MTNPSPHQPATGGPKKQPYGPGILMVLGLFMLVIAAWCGYDLATKEEWQEEGKTGAIVFNWAGMIVFGLAAVYAFVLAAIRSKGAAAGSFPTAEEKPAARGAPSEGGGDAGDADAADAEDNAEPPS